MSRSPAHPRSTLTATAATGFALSASLMLTSCLVLILPSPALADTIRNQQWMLSALEISRAHDYSEGANVTVGLIDTGVDAGHPDLTGSVLAGIDLTSGSPRPTGRADTNGHGTAMAGLIVGHGHGVGQTDGVLGIAPRASLLPIRTSVGSLGLVQNTAEAIDWAAAHGARVICMAFGSPQPSAAVETAIEHAYEKDIVLIAAAGNTVEGARFVQYPAAYPDVIAVAGTDQLGQRAATSVEGNSLSIAAPSTGIVSTGVNHTYISSDGTSNAAAIVAGAAALVRSRFPNLSASQVVDRLTATAIDKGPPGHDDEYGYGLLNIDAALTAELPSATPSVSAPSNTSASLPAPRSSAPSSAVAASPESDSTTTIVIVVIAIVFAMTVGAGLVVRRRARPRR